MSISVARSEIQRFLKSTEPEVLCISGGWGVGKTFAWQKFLGEAKAQGNLGISRYAYVSLFGSNSLSDLRNAIVENTVVLEASSGLPSAASLHKVLRKGEKYARQSRPVLDVAAAIFRMKDAGDALYRAAFLAIRDQIVCLDDLERAGEGLKMRDVLGLASMLREQRNCKVVLLLNKEQAVPQGVQELDRQLEKVIDTFLKFEPTSAEATQIAISGADEIAIYLRDRLETLGITNIRVMKKIERWAHQLQSFLERFDKQVKYQAISTVALAGWSFLQPDNVPPLSFIRSLSTWTGMLGKDDAPEDERRWREDLRRYGFGQADELDEAILQGVEAGYFNQTELLDAANLVAQRYALSGGDNSFSRAWERYHRTLTVDDAEILDALYQGLVENIETVNTPSLNGTITFLREYGRQEQASDLVLRFVKTFEDNPEFFSRDHLFFGDPVDQELHAALEEKRIKYRDARNPAERLKEIAEGNGFNPEDDIALFSQLTPDGWIALFDGNEGKELKGMIEWARILGGQEGAEGLKVNLNAAFEEIAARSPMRAKKLRAWGALPKMQD